MDWKYILNKSPPELDGVHRRCTADFIFWKKYVFLFYRKSFKGISLREHVESAEALEEFCGRL